MLPQGNALLFTNFLLIYPPELGPRSSQAVAVALTARLPLVTVEADLPCGAVAQLGARLNGIQEVTGSTPVSSTNLTIHLQ